MFRRLRQRWLLRRTPRTPIGEASSSRLVKIVGRVIYRPRPLLSPVTKTPCAYYDLEIDEWYNGVAHEVLSMASSEAVFIDDDTGHGAVELDKADISLRTKDRVLCGLVRDAPYVIEALLNRQGKTAVDETGLLKGITFRERVLMEGDVIAAWGQTEWAVAAEDPSIANLGYRELPKQLLVRAPRGRLALMSDDREATAL